MDKKKNIKECQIKLTFMIGDNKGSEINTHAQKVLFYIQMVQVCAYLTQLAAYLP